MANKKQLSILKQGVEAWNKWRKEEPDQEIDLKAANLSWADLKGANLSDAKLNEANLGEANLSHAKLSRADLRGANLSYAKLNRANLVGADLELASLCTANLMDADLREVNLIRADLRGADLKGANLRDADLRGADLSNSSLVSTMIERATISQSNVYGVNVWDLIGEFKEQNDLTITPWYASPITVDNIKVAQFVYLILNNKEIRDVIDTVTTKAVLILGRFYEERKQVLDALKEALRKRGFVPILFDFEPSKQRDLTETIQLLANMAKFIIADITDAKSIPQELSHLIPLLPSVPIQPILLRSKEKEYAMFEHWRSFNTVLPEFLYLDKQDLLDNLEAKIIQPIDTWRKGRNEVSILQNRIKELEEKISGSK